MQSSEHAGPVRLGVDVGGTFTDLVALVDGAVVTAKVPSTPRDQSDGMHRAIERAGLASADVTQFAHGTTVATNALLERRGAKTALVTTEGFRDVIEIGRQDRLSLYDLTARRPVPLVPRELRFTARERMGPNGVIVPLEEDDVERLVAELRAAQIEAVSVCLLFGFLHPEHERRLGAAIRDSLPDVHVSLSSEILQEFREFERFSTTVANAYLAPVLGRYLGGVVRRLEGSGVRPPVVMQSSGGVMAIDDAAARAAACVLSGPAGGVVGAAHVARAAGYANVVTFDMGGTSTDVASVVDGAIGTTTEAVVGGVPIKLPMVDVHSVSAGGGSIAWVDEGGALRVGPRSAGADPGPAAYGLGGEDATVTDASLVLGHLGDGSVLGGDVELRRVLAVRAIERVAAKLGTDVDEAAAGIVEVASIEMVRALRVISVHRGLDPRDFAMVAFGGAGPMHACALAEELGVRTVLVPRAGGVLSALGLAISEARRDYAAPVLSSIDELEPARLARALEELGRAADAELGPARHRPAADLRYRGQSYELTVDADDLRGLEERFHALHEQRYGYRMDDEPVEIVNVRLTAILENASPSLREDEEATTPTGDPPRRAVRFAGHRLETPVWSRDELGRGSRLSGPAIVEFPEATCVVPPGWEGRVHPTGTIVLERS
jgi:N-methylhydantoinase A